jgi:hypothetical protein
VNSLNDTSPEADRVLTKIYQKMPIGEKWRRLGELYRTARILHATGFRLRRPLATSSEIHNDWLALTLGESMVKMLKEGAGGSRQ